MVFTRHVLGYSTHLVPTSASDLARTKKRSEGISILDDCALLVVLTRSCRIFSGMEGQAHIYTTKQAH